MTDILNAASRTAFEEAIWRDVGQIRTSVEQSAILESVEAQCAAIDEALRSPLSEVDRADLLVHADSMRRAAGAARRTRIVQERAWYEGAGDRDRTYADRRAFTLAEATEAAAAEMLMEREPEATPTPVAPPRSLSEASLKERAAAREAETAARRAGFLRFLGEVAYRALPLDEDEKAPLRETVLEGARELAESAADLWDLAPTATSAADEITHALAGVGNTEAAVAAVSEACRRPDLALGQMVEQAGSELEQRIVEAVVATKERAALVEEQLAEAASLGGDRELIERRLARTAVGRPSLLESLYVANRRTLAESLGQDAAESVVLAEAVCQYAVTESLTALGALPRVEPADLAKKLSGRFACAL